jgi:nucleoside-diphosphate-sugar epimerase
MKAIITGATGGLGQNLTHYLQALGWEIIALGRNKAIGHTLGVPFIALELSDKKAVFAAFEAFANSDVVFHCAALSSPWGKYEAFYRANVQATGNIIAAMQQFGIPKIVHVSTPSIYFDFNDQLNVPESYRAKSFVNHYAATKYQAEQIVLQSPLESVILRPRGLFGEHDSVLIPRLERVARKGFLPLIRHKEPLIDVTYIQNVVHALHLAAVKNLPAQSIFNITNGQPVTIREIYALFAQALEWDIKYKEIPYALLKGCACALECAAYCCLTPEPLITRYGAGLIATSQTLDISHARQILAYQPIYTLQEGIARYAAWKRQTL